jgi:hypothetical protein
MKMRNWLLAAAMIWAVAGAVTAASPVAKDVIEGKEQTRLAQYYPTAYGCCTQYGRCPLAMALPPGAPCSCASPYGPIPGYAC